MSKINPDIQKERDTATFDVQKLTHQLDSNDSITERRREIEAIALGEPEFTNGPDYHFLSRNDLYSESVRKAVHYIRCCEKYGLDNQADSYWFRNMVFPNEAPPIGLHSAMFLPSLRGQCTEEQKERWMKDAEEHKILGTYAQTELGHGTFVRGLETTATFDPETQEFVLHSPTLTSTKWWPGGLGKTSNYAIVMALLHTNGKNHGMHGFVVQLRDLDTHQPLPGITVGDIGPKLGYNTIDNGFLRFDNFRIPRDHMLMKNSQVHPDGTYVRNAKNDRLAYGTMVFVRAMIIYDVAARGLAQSVTIATRYSAVRRQSELRPGEPEPQIMDFQTQQHKLFPLLASAYAIWFVGLHMREMYFTINYEIQQGNVEMLPELHGLSSGLKAYATDLAMWGIERSRLACGGHGYSQASGIPKIYVSTVAACTYEGENTVMYLQAARYLVKAYQTVRQGGTLEGSAEYLQQENGARRSEIDRGVTLEALLDAYRHRATRLVQVAVERISRLQSEGKDEADAWNLSSVLLVNAAHAHSHYYVVKTFAEAVDKAEEPEIGSVLLSLCRLYAAHGLVERAAEFIEDGYVSGAQLDLVRDSSLSLLAEIRPNAIALTDAFDFRDEMLLSILGRFDGNVYENLYKWAKSSPLNEPEVTEAFRNHIKSLRNDPVQSKL